MASRRERKEQLRREREAAAAKAEAAQRRRRIAAYGAGAVLAVGAVVGAVVVLPGGGGDKGSAGGSVLPSGGSVPAVRTTDLNQAAKAAGCQLTKVRVAARNHVSGAVQYPTKPPAGGNHYEIPAEDGSYEQPPAPEGLVHALEHGRVVIWFKRNLPASARANLRAFFEQDGYQQLLTPDATGSRYAVAATAWNRDPDPLGTGRLLGCPRMTETAFDALAAFRDEHRGNGPEPVP